MTLDDRSYFFETRMVVLDEDHVVSIVRDVTQKIKAEDKLRESEENFRMLAENSNDVLNLLDKNHVPLYISPAAKSVLSYEMEFFKNHSIFDIVHPDDKERLQNEIEKSVANKQNSGFRTFRILTQAGEIKWIEANVRYLYDDQQKLEKVFIVLRDITARRRIETQLEQSEGRYRNLYENAFVSIWEEDFSDVKDEIDRLKMEGIADFREYFLHHPETVRELAGMIEVVDINATTLKWFGAAEKSEIIGNADRFFSNDTMELLQEEFIAIAEGRRHVEGETKGFSLAGDELDLLVRVSLPSEEQIPNRVIVAVLDITERKKTEKEKETLLYELNHRVKNNLMMVSSLINLKDSALGDAADLSDIARQIDAIRIVHEQLYLSGDVQFLDAVDYITDLLATVFSFTKKHITIQQNIDVHTISTKTAVTLGLIINEIATNTVKHGFPEAETGTFKLSLTEDRDGHGSVLILSNTGNPFPKDVELDHPGTLGLQLIRALVDQLDGTIDLQREPHPVFTIRFPAP